MKKNKTYRLVVLGLVIISIFSVEIVWAKKTGYKVSCRSIIFSNSTKIKRLYGKSVHDHVLPASTAKVMTALLVLERLPLDKYVTVSARAVSAEPTKLYFKPGEKYKVRDLLYAILIKSANDASIVLAEAVAGSEWKFVQLMNRRAREIGAKHTRFANSNGLPSRKIKQHTTAYDMYLIFRRALRHDFFRGAITKKYKTIYSKAGREIKLKTHNKILFKDWKRKIYGKTGYTKAAKACFVGTINKDGDTLIIGAFGCTKRWDDIKHVVSRYGRIAL